MSSTEHDSTPVASIGRYELRTLLGRGAMADVYLATDSKMGRDVALKVLSPPFRRSLDLVRRFEREAQAMASVSNGNVVSIFEVDSQGGIPFIAMEHVPGPTLRTLLNRAPLPTETVLDVGQQLAGGLAGIHRAGIVHRDVKPENVIVSTEGWVKILDFGLSKPIESADDERARGGESSLTLPGTILGTPQYMSPEQASGSRVDFRADQFALGAILYEMASGVSAFQRDTLPRTLAAIAESKPSGLERFRAIAPRALRTVVERLLSKRPEDRYPDMGAVVAELGRAARGPRVRALAAGTLVAVAITAAVTAIL
jgi:eukaryotic-like serine/threonine-protein kinase